MAQTFDIRFERSTGLAGIFEAPANSFRWTGNGRLSIDGRGISVAAHRGLLTLLTGNRSRRIPTANLKEVFREGDALRVEFATAELPRASLRFWARDRDAAAQIVQLLPMSRSVEIEENSAASRFRINWRVVALLGGIVAALALGLLALVGGQPDGEPGELAMPVHVPVATTPSAVTPHSSNAQAAPLQVANTATPDKLPAAAVQPSSPGRRREIVIPLNPSPSTSPVSSIEIPEPETAPYAPSSQSPDTTASAADSQVVELQPIVFRVLVSHDGIVPIVPGMASYETARRQKELFYDDVRSSSWWEITVRVSNSPDFDDPALWALRDAELAASRAARSFDPEFARVLIERVRQYVD